MSKTRHWPGARWWRCDLHVHTPGSHDFTDRKATAAEWLDAGRAAGLDVVAVTDHNTDAFIDTLQRACREDLAAPVLFPGVELTVSPGVHLLALFDPEKDGKSVTALLGACGIPVERFGTHEACSHLSVVDTLARIAECQGLCIAAHVDDEKGLRHELTGQTRLQALGSPHLAALEITPLLDDTSEPAGRELARVMSSDAHSLEQIGRRSTWIKMTRPDLEGLRLALQDGPLSVRLFAEVESDPNTHAAFVIESIEIVDARYMGRGQPFAVSFNPWLNAVIGGRGTGKSTLVDFLRIALRRERELPEALRSDFADRQQAYAGRDKPGLRTDKTLIRVVYRKNGTVFRVQWSEAGDAEPIQKYKAGRWEATDGDVASRLPVQIYSQKQVFQLASAPEALLQIIDQAPSIERAAWDERWRVLESRVLGLRAKRRAVEGELAAEPRLRGELDDVRHKLEVVERTRHAETLRAFQRRGRQRRAVGEWQQEIAAAGGRLDELADALLPDDLPAAAFDLRDPADAHLLAQVSALHKRLAEIHERLRRLAEDVRDCADEAGRLEASSPWAEAVRAAEKAYQDVRQELAAQGVDDPGAYGRLVQERQSLEQRLHALEGQRTQVAVLEREYTAALEELSEWRRELTRRRRAFLDEALAENAFVRIRLQPYGAMGSVEGELRAVLGCDDARFQKDLGSVDADGGSGWLGDLYKPYDSTLMAAEESKANVDTIDKLFRVFVPKFEAKLAEKKRELHALHAAASDAPVVQDQRFAKYMRQLPPERLDRLDCWFPPDSLAVSYSPDGRSFRPIDQASPGQKTAALLAFLVSHGEQPLVLDQPEDDLDNHLIFDLLVTQLRRIKPQRQVIVVTHNPNIVVNGDAELVIALDVRGGQTHVACAGGLQEQAVREEVCRVMEGGREAFEKRYRRIALGGRDVG